MKLAHHLVAAFLLASSTAVLAQSGPPSEGNESNQIRRTTQASDNDSRYGFPVSSLQLNADTDGSDLAVTLSSASDNPSSFGETVYALTLKAPVNKESKGGTLITESGITSGFGAEFSVSTVIGSYKPPADFAPIHALIERSRERCTAAAVQAGKTSDADVSAFCEFGRGILERDRKKLYLTEAEEKKLRDHYAPANSGHASQSLWFGNLTLGIGAEDFKFRDIATFAKEEERHTSYSASASIGYTSRPGAPFFLVGFEYKRGYEAPDKRTLCQPATPPTPQECFDDVFAPPARDLDRKAFGLMRVTDIFGHDRPVAVELKLAYDFKDEVFGFELPIYVLADSKGQLRGGLKLGWDNGEKGFALGVFVGVPFNLVGR